MASIRHFFAAALVLTAARELSAQCSDGTPPPCDTRRPVALTAVRTPPPLPSAADRGKRFLILPFRNVTRQADQDWLVEGSTTMLVDALSRWQGISVVPDEKLYPALKRAGISPGSVPDPAQVRRVAEETGGWTAVTGEVLVTGGRVRVTARASDVPTGRELLRASAEVPAGGDIRLGFDSLSLKLLRAAGVDSVTPDIANSTTHNLDAYRAYLSGQTHMRREEIKPAIADYQRAVQLDSGFALAWAQLAAVTLVTDPTQLTNAQNAAGRYFARAVALSSKLPPRQRDLVLANDALMQAHFSDARRMLQALVASDSSDLEAMTALVSLEMSDPILVDVPGGKRPRGSRNLAAKLAKRTAELDPSRSSLYAVLSQLYASAGVPGSTGAFGIDKEPASFQEYMQLVQQPAHLRTYRTVFRDSLLLVPAESIKVIPKDSLKVFESNARAAARQWAERWVSVAGTQSVPYWLLSQLDALDHDYAAALRNLAKAESLGIQNPNLSVPATRLTYVARSGDLAQAARLADSLTSAGFFAKPPSAIYLSSSAAAWSFALHLVGNRHDLAATLLDQGVAFFRMVTSGNPASEGGAFGLLMGNEDPDQEPGITRAVRALELDSLRAHIVVAASSPIGSWLPILLPSLSEIVDTTKKKLPDLLRSGDVLAGAGKGALAFQLVSDAVVDDSTLEVEAAKLPWYRGGAEALNASRRATQSRFHPSSANVAPDRAVFEWTVDDSLPFIRNHSETPIGQGEYRWLITVNAGDRIYRFNASGTGRMPSGVPTAGSLADILPPTALRSVQTGKLAANGSQTDTTLLQGVALRTEIAPKVLRMIVTDHGVIEDIRRAHPDSAKFEFRPCIRPVGSPKAECAVSSVKIVYP